MPKELSLQIPPSFWDQADVDSDDGRLAGVMRINRPRFHVEAIPVIRERGLVHEFDVRGFETIEIGDREYVVIITPFSL